MTETLERAPTGQVNLEAEGALLCAMLLSPDAIDRVLQLGVRAEDLAVWQNAEVFAAIEALHERRSAVDPVTVSAELRRTKGQTSDGYLADLATLVPTTLHAEHHAGLVLEASVRRRLRETAWRILQAVDTGEGTPARELLERAEEQLFQLGERRLRTGPDAFGTVLTRVFDRWDEQQKTPGEIPGLSLGFPQLDRLTDGLQRASLFVLAARPGVGKTALAMNVATHVGMRGQRPVLVFSLEMPADRLVERELAAESGVSPQQARYRTLAAGEWQHVIQAANRMHGGRVAIDETPAITMGEMRARCRRAKRSAAGLELVIVDYVGLMGVRDRRRFSSRREELGVLFWGLKQLAKELDLPVFCLHHLNRETERQGEPRLSNLSDSGEIEKHADLIAFLHREEPESEEARHAASYGVKFIVGKNRNGPTGAAWLRYVPALTRFEAGAVL